MQHLPEEHEAHLQAVYDAIQDGLVVFDQAGAVVLLNEAQAHLFGYPGVAEMERDLAHLAQVFALSTLDGTPLPVDQWPVSRVMQGERLRDLVLQVRRRDTGQEWIVSFTGEPVRDAQGRQVLSVVVSRDVTDAHRALRSLRASEERYRTLFGSIDQGYCTMQILLDEHGRPADYRFLEMNPAFERHTGLADAVGRTARELVPDLEDRWIQAYGRVALTGVAEKFVDESEAMGRIFQVEAFRIGDPAELRVALLFSDITARVRSEQGLHEVLEALRASEERLRESDRRKDEYLAMLGHELRNPLAAVQNAAELIKLIAREEPRLERPSAVLERQAAHMARLIDGLLEVSRIVQGKIRLERDTVDVARILERVLEDRGAERLSRNLRLECDLPKAPLWVCGDPVRLAQVFDNLVGNALKFTPAPGRVRATLREEAGQAVLRVQDDGVGIAPQRLGRIFEPFHQEEQDVARGSGGLGLGLALARGLVELHGGSIEAHSFGPGSGAEFTVRLPQAPAPRGAESRREQPGLPALRILLVEDHGDAAEMLVALLEMQGHQVRLAGSADEALDLLRAERMDVVLCDIGLPGRSGYDFARAVREDPSRRGVSLIALTGYGQPEDRRRTREAGFEHHLTKPVDLAHLQRVLAEVARSASGSGSS